MIQLDPQSSGREPGHMRFRLISHDAAMPRRLAWRIELLGGVAETSLISEITDTSSFAAITRDETIVFDLGWSEAEIEQAMQTLFAITADDHRRNIVVLAPWFDPSTRPAWAELGVTLVFDRTTSPPEVVERVVAIA